MTSHNTAAFFKRVFLLLSGIVVLFFTTSFHFPNITKKFHVRSKGFFPQVSPLEPYIDSATDTSGVFTDLEHDMPRFMYHWGLAGVSVAVAKNDKLVYTKGFGYADREDSVAVNVNQLFRIASVSKLVTATAIMKLVDEGKLNLTDTVFGRNGVLSQYTQAKDHDIFKITVHDLLVHRGGWSWWRPDPMFSPRYVAARMGIKGAPTQEDIIHFVLEKVNLRFKPGTVYAYSNFGYMILGKVIEAASGTSYDQFVQQEVLHPAGIYGMKMAGNLEKDRKANEVKYYNYPRAWKVKSFDGKEDKIDEQYGGNDLTALEAAGDWLATPSQLLKLVASIDDLNKQNNILSDEAISQMTDVSVGSEAVGWKWVNHDGTWIRTGTLAGTSALVVKRPDGISYALISNSSVWMGPRFNHYIMNYMERHIGKIDQPLPERNLFAQSPVSPYPLPTIVP